MLVYRQSIRIHFTITPTYVIETTNKNKQDDEQPSAGYFEAFKIVILYAIRQLQVNTLSIVFSYSIITIQVP